MYALDALSEHVGSHSWERPGSLFQDLPDLLTVQDMKVLTGLSEQTIRTEINNGGLPGCRIGRRLYVPKVNLINYVITGGGING
ncbi:helix-turn-helix domain-containing protein [Anaerotardibacter muris]|uniref:helix-turn-helix domain-containing protein n=1 Tax=Anaerotardibacter muris TaxID=2941505 RepID=UPI003B8471A6